jgi:hypothetical protein
LRKSCPNATLPTTNPTSSDLGTNWGLRAVRLATNGLSYGTTSCTDKLFVLHALADISAGLPTQKTKELQKWEAVGRLLSLGYTRNFGNCIFGKRFYIGFTPRWTKLRRRSTYAFYSEGFTFKSRPIDRLSCLWHCDRLPKSLHPSIRITP